MTEELKSKVLPGRKSLNLLVNWLNNGTFSYDNCLQQFDKIAARLIGRYACDDKNYDKILKETLGDDKNNVMSHIHYLLSEAVIAFDIIYDNDIKEYEKLQEDYNELKKRFDFLKNAMDLELGT
jgi:hypothetical protein